MNFFKRLAVKRNHQQVLKAYHHYRRQGHTAKGAMGLAKLHMRIVRSHKNDY